MNKKGPARYHSVSGFAPILIVVILGAISVIGFLVVTPLLTQSPPPSTSLPPPPSQDEVVPKEKYCKKDTDCQPISRNCCGCSDESVNQEYYKAIAEKVKAKCKGVLCTQEACPLYSKFPKCINHRCELKEIDHSTYKPEECLDLDNQYEKDYCLYEVAIASENPTTCQSINDETLNNQCLRSLNR